MHQDVHELVFTMMAWCMLYAGLGRKGAEAGVQWLPRMAGDKAQTVSPSVDTAHMVRWSDSDL